MCLSDIKFFIDEMILWETFSQRLAQRIFKILAKVKILTILLTKYQE